MGILTPLHIWKCSKYNIGGGSCLHFPFTSFPISPKSTPISLSPPPSTSSCQRHQWPSRCSTQWFFPILYLTYLHHLTHSSSNTSHPPAQLLGDHSSLVFLLGHWLLLLSFFTCFFSPPQHLSSSEPQDLFLRLLFCPYSHSELISVHGFKWYLYRWLPSMSLLPSPCPWTLDSNCVSVLGGLVDISILKHLKSNSWLYTSTASLTQICLSPCEQAQPGQLGDEAPQKQ